MVELENGQLRLLCILCHDLPEAGWPVCEGCTRPVDPGPLGWRCLECRKPIHTFDECGTRYKLGSSSGPPGYLCQSCPSSETSTSESEEEFQDEKDDKLRYDDGSRDEADERAERGGDASAGIDASQSLTPTTSPVGGSARRKGTLDPAYDRRPEECRASGCLELPRVNAPLRESGTGPSSP